MPYYAGDGQRYRMRLAGSMYRVGDGIFSRFSFKKLGRFVGKVAKSPIGGLVTSLIPGVGGAVASLATRFMGSGVGKTVQQVAAPFAPLLGAALDVGGGTMPGTLAAEGVAGGTPGMVSARTSGRVRVRRRYRPRRRRRR